HYDAELSPLVEQIQKLKPTNVIGTSGAVENLAAMSSSGDPETVLKKSGLDKVLGALIESRSEDRASMKGLDDKRRDQILAAALLVQELLRRLEVDQIKVCQSAPPRSDGSRPPLPLASRTCRTGCENHAAAFRSAPIPSRPRPPRARAD